MLGDGAKGIWGIAEEHFPGATEIVDLYPGREHLAKVAKLRFGVRAVQSPEWLSARRDELDDGKVEAVIAAMSQPPVPDNGPQEEVQKEREYFRGNAERMRYAEFRSQGLFVGSGVVEAGCKIIFGQRLKLSGMHWTVRVPMPSSRCVATNSVVAGKNSGRVVRPTSRVFTHKFVAHPCSRIFLTTVSTECQSLRGLDTGASRRSLHAPPLRSPSCLDSGFTSPLCSAAR